MPRVLIRAERTIGAPADQVYRYIADFQNHHPRWLLRAIYLQELDLLDRYARAASAG